MPDSDAKPSRGSTVPLRGGPADFVMQHLGKLVLLLGSAVFVLAIQSVAPQFLTVTNVLQVLRQAAIPGIIAVAVTYVIIAGNFDLSVGSILSLTSVLVVIVHNQMGPGWAVLAAMAAGAAAGSVNGILVGYLRLNSVIATLGMLSALQGLTLIITGGTNVTVQGADPAGWFTWLGRGYLFGVPVPVFVLVIFVVVFEFVLRGTVFGRRIYAVGGNVRASEFSGIRVPGMVFLTFVISGLVTGIAASVFASRVMAAQNDAGSGYELTVLAAIILGGTSIQGGSGSVLRTLVGILVLSFIQNGLLVAGFPYYAQWIVTWVVIVVAVLIDRIVAERGAAR